MEHFENDKILNSANSEHDSSLKLHTKRHFIFICIDVKPTLVEGV